MIGTMKKSMIKSGWLVMAAALTFGFTACSSDDSTTEQQQQTPPTPPTTRTIQVTVGAGINSTDNNTNRAQIVDGDGEDSKLDLQFTAGDQLFVESSNGGYGTLTLSSGAGTKSATFTGTVTLGDGDNENLNGFKATLIPEGNGGTISTTGNKATYIAGYAKVTATTGETLRDIMAKKAYVYGTFADGSGSVSLEAKSAFIEFKVASFDAASNHNVKVLPLSDYENNEDKITVTANGDGKLDFVVWLEVKPFPFLLVEIDDNRKVFVEGKGETEVKNGSFAAMHYTFNTTAETRNELSVSGTPSDPTISGKKYTYPSDKGATNITIKGEGMQYTFDLENTGSNTVTFGEIVNTKKTGITVLGNSTFMTCKGHLNIDLIGTTNIRIATNDGYGIYSSRDLKLSCSQVTSAILIVTIKADNQTAIDNAKKYMGLYGSNYNGGDPTDADNLAAYGYTVTRTGYDNGDGTYSFRYKVKKNN